ncbi:MAG: AraC family transcriptional regulator, partial [Rhodobacteraceae bacterium]|nr:AraC family transcriptional regulator [Paracoccaceae bacterium]
MTIMNILKTKKATGTLAESFVGSKNISGDKCYIRSATLIGFDSFVIAKGFDPVSVMVASGIPCMARSNPDALISFRAYSRLLETAARSYSLPNLGLEWAEALAPRFPSLSPILLLAYFSQNVQEWLAHIGGYMTYYCNAFEMNIAVDAENDLVTLRYDFFGPVLVSRQLMEHKMAVAVMMMRQVTGQHDKSPVCVRFRHGEPVDTSRHRKVFGCPLEFSCNHNEIVFEAKYLQLPTDRDVRNFRPLVDSFLRQRLESTRN